MCSKKCSKCIVVPLYILALVSMSCNILLFFPDFKTEFATNLTENLTVEVTLMGGLIGGGIVVLLPTIHIHLISSKKCCPNRCGMFLSIAFAALGVFGALYSMIVAFLGIYHGPMCLVKTQGNETWEAPFANSNGTYLYDKDLWSICEQPKEVVEFNLGLFSILLVAGCLEVIFCVIQMFTGLCGCICVTCKEVERLKRERSFVETNVQSDPGAENESVLCCMEECSVCLLDLCSALSR